MNEFTLLTEITRSYFAIGSLRQFRSITIMVDAVFVAGKQALVW
jgi:hypothetical protein